VGVRLRSRKPATGFGRTAAPTIRARHGRRGSRPREPSLGPAPAMARERGRTGAPGPPPVPPAFPARARCSTAASTPRNLTSGRRPRRLHQDSPCPKASGPEGRDPSV